MRGQELVRRYLFSIGAARQKLVDGLPYAALANR
jgi:hypothetical protein